MWDRLVAVCWERTALFCGVDDTDKKLKCSVTSTTDGWYFHVWILLCGCARCRERASRNGFSLRHIQSMPFVDLYQPLSTSLSLFHGDSSEWDTSSCRTRASSLSVSEWVTRRDLMKTNCSTVAMLKHTPHIYRSFSSSCQWMTTISIYFSCWWEWCSAVKKSLCMCRLSTSHHYSLADFPPPRPAAISLVLFDVIESVTF